MVHKVSLGAHGGALQDLASAFRFDKVHRLERF